MGSDAVQDTVIFNHTALGLTNQTVVTVNNFDETDNDRIAVTLNGTNITNGFTTLTAVNRTVSGANRVVEIAISTSLVASLGTLTDDSDSGTIEDAIAAASINSIGDGNSNYTFIVYPRTPPVPQMLASTR